VPGHLKSGAPGKYRSKEQPNEEISRQVNQRRERAELHHLITQGQAPARTLAHARILLKAASGEKGPAWTDLAISETLEVSTATIERVRQRFVEEGVQVTFTRRRPSTPHARKLDGAQEAYLIALICSPPEEGRKRWTLQLLADKLVALYDEPLLL
jgi:hypothetical protein